MADKLSASSVNVQRRNLLKSMVWCTTLFGTSRLAAIMKNNQATGLVYDDLFLQHSLGSDHPESPARLSSIMRALSKADVMTRLTHIMFEHDYPDPITLVHSQKHLRGLETQQSNHVALKAVAGILQATDDVCRGRLRNAFCATRPPGHHATNTGRVEGFCFYNGAAIAARYAQEVCDLQKILIIDWDYHHGNGTETFFYTDPSVLFFSTHDYYAYPGTGDPARIGEGKGTGLTMNVHLDCGAGDEEIIATFKEKLLPAANQFKPDLIIISAGFDSRKDDLLGCFKVSDQGYVTLTNIVMQLAEEYCENRVVSILEGGYSLTGLASATTCHVLALMQL